MTEDFHDKTEEPTPKKLAEAREKGYVAKSQDLIVSIHLIFCMVIFFFFSGFMFKKLAFITVSIFNHLDYSFASIEIVGTFLKSGLLSIFYILLPLMAGVVFISMLMNLLQTGFVFSLYPIAPKWGKLNFFNPQNYERHFGMPAMIKIIFSLLRLLLVLLFSWLVNGQRAFQIFNLGKGTAKDLLEFIQNQSLWVGTSIALGYLVIAILDFFYQKWLFIRKMRMSKREVKDELKQVEGDVNVKHKIKTTMRALALSSATYQIPYADFLIADGANFVVAIMHRPSKMPVPICIGKGTLRKAIHLREIAKRYEIPIIENSSLAKALFKKIDSGALITPEFYAEVAAIYARN